MQKQATDLYQAAGKLSGIALVVALALSGPALAQKAAEGKEPPQNTGTIDEVTGKALNAAIEFLNMEKYQDAANAIAALKLDKLSPYSRSKVEQILFNISYS